MTCRRTIAIPADNGHVLIIPLLDAARQLIVLYRRTASSVRRLCAGGGEGEENMLVMSGRTSESKSTVAITEACIHRQALKVLLCSILVALARKARIFVTMTSSTDPCNNNTTCRRSAGTNNRWGR